MKYFLVILSVVAILLSSCVEENVSGDPSLRLSFSCDTLVFDTLIAGQPSATKTLMMYNENKNALIVDEINLASGASSAFRFNVDGRTAAPGQPIRDIVIKGRDSLFVLVEMTPDEILDDEVSLSVAFDSLLFAVNGNVQNVKLLGVGRNAHLINSWSIATDTVLRNTKPYLVFGYLHVPEDRHLTIDTGVTIYMHAGANIVVDGSLDIAGTYSSPVKICGDRNDHINDVAQTPYYQTPNQWGGIYLQNAGSAYTIRNARIDGMSSGVMLIGAHRSSPSLIIENCIIHNSGVYGVYAQMANLSITNSEISNCGESCLLVVGGNTYMAHTTIANYYRFATRKTSSVRAINFISQGILTQSYPIKSFVVENSIIFGQNSEELELVVDSSTQANIYFSHSLIKGKQVMAAQYNNCLWARSQNYDNAIDTVFKCVNITDIDKTGYYNFRLDSLSLARNAASTPVAMRYPFDLDSVSRTIDSQPDLGAYEFHSIEN